MTQTIKGIWRAASKYSFLYLYLQCKQCLSLLLVSSFLQYHIKNINKVTKFHIPALFCNGLERYCCLKQLVFKFHFGVSAVLKLILVAGSPQAGMALVCAPHSAVVEGKSSLDIPGSSGCIGSSCSSSDSV